MAKRTVLKRKHLKNDNSGKDTLKNDKSENETIEKDNSETEESERASLKGYI